MSTAVLDTPETKQQPVKADRILLPLASLQSALAKISPAIPGASCAVPILRTVRIESTDTGTSFTATDLDLSMRATLPRIQVAGEPFLLFADRLLGYAKMLQGEDVSIAPGESRAKLRCGRSVTQLPVGQLANYPQTPFLEGDGKEEPLRLTQAMMLRMLEHTTFAVSMQESQYVLGGSLLEYANGKLSLVATDGHRLALYTVPIEGLHGIEPVILPYSLLKALERGLEDTNDLNVSLSHLDSSIALSVGGEMPLDIVCRKLSAKFPNYQAVMPKGDPEVRFTVNSTEMLASIARCVAMSDRASLAVKLTISPEVLEMKAVDSTAGETEETINIASVQPFTKFVTGFNGQYLVDVLKASEGDVTMSFAEAAANVALMVESEPQPGETFQYVAMPMRV